MRTFDPVDGVGAHRATSASTTGLLVPAMLQFMLQVRPERIDLSRRALDHERRLAGAGDADRGLRRARHRDPPGLRPHRELRPGLPDQPRRGADAGRARRARSSSSPRCASSTRTATTSRPDTPGELICAGNHIMVGYWNRPDATAETIVDGWLHTGDIAIVDKDGYVYDQRPHQGHDHQRRRERVPGRDRERHPRPPRRRRRRRHRPPVASGGARRRSPSSSAATTR